MPINTVFQLLADEGTPRWRRARRDRARARPARLLADAASWPTRSRTRRTTGLLDARTGDVGARADRAARAAGAAVRRAGRARARCRRRCSPHATGIGGAAGARRRRATTPPRPSRPRRCAARDAAILSSGHVVAAGLELPAPVLGRPRAGVNLTNERGVDGTIRLLQERDGPVAGAGVPPRVVATRDYAELHRLAARGAARRAAVRPRRRRASCAPATCRRGSPLPARAGQRAAATRGEIVRSIFDRRSPASTGSCSSARARDRPRGRRVHVIGGGAQNELLCQLTADVTGRQVLAGPVEATALGNVLVQARARGRARLARRDARGRRRVRAAASFEPDRDGAASTALPRGDGLPTTRTPSLLTTEMPITDERPTTTSSPRRWRDRGDDVDAVERALARAR